MKRVFLLLTVLGSFGFMPTALADVPIVNETDVVKDGTDEFVDVNPCTGDRARISIVFNAVFHITEFADGTVHVTGTTTGTFSLDALKASAVDFTGRFTQWFGFNGNNKNATGSFTFSVTGTGTDGSTLHFQETAQFKVNANGDVVVEFDKIRCG